MAISQAEKEREREGENSSEALKKGNYLSL